MKDIKAMLEVRKKIKQKTPKFKRTDFHRHAKLADKWRTPEGRDNKIRMRRAGHVNRVQVGYGGPKAVREMHPKGLFETIVNNVADLEKIDPKTHAARISAGVGNKKKIQIMDAAKKLKVWVLNPAVRKLEKKSDKKAEEKKADVSKTPEKSGESKKTETKEQTKEATKKKS